MEVTDILNFSKPLVRHAATGSRRGEEIWFMLDTDCNPGDESVVIVDREQKPVNPDYRNFSGAKSNLVKAITNIMDRNSGAIVWGDEQDGRVRLRENPQLLYMLSMAGNVIDRRGEAISFSDENAHITYRIRFDEPEQNAEPAPEEKSRRKVAASVEVAAPTGETLNDVTFLSDSFILAGHAVYPILSVGDNYINMAEFCKPFRADQIPAMLSVFLSYVDNVDIDVDGCEVIYARSKETGVPTIIFERIDSDNALVMSVRQTFNRIPPALTDKFDLTRVASETEDKIVVRDIEPIEMEPYREEIGEKIVDSAPTKREGREYYRDGETFILPEELASSFIFRGLPSLLATYRVIGTDKLKSYKVTAVTPRLNVNLSSGIDFLEGTANVEVGSETISLSDLLNRYGRDHYIELSDGTRAIIDDTYMKRLQRIFRHNRGNGDKLKISFFDLPEIEALLNERLKGPGIERQREIYEGFNNLDKETIDTKELHATLRPYQDRGVRWIKYLHDNNLGGCLADDMGLGKTIQTITMFLQIYPAEQKPSLVVMPRSLIFNWEKELDRFAPSLTHATYYGSGRDLDEALKSNIVLTTYAILRNDIDELRKRDFAYVVLDESQNIKNVTAQITRAAWLLKADHRLAISGTPIENNLTELYSLFHFLNPTMFGTADDFNRYYTYPIQRNGDELAAEELRRKVFPFILRRLKKNVLTDLPDRIDQTLYAEMSPELATFYERRRRFYADQINSSIATEGINKSQMLILQALSELRRIASIPESLSDGLIHSPKLELLAEQLETAVTNKHKVVVFYNFIAGLELTAERLENLGIGYEMMTGATHNRKKVIDRFQNDPECKVLLMTLKTGGTGLNLTVADTVIIFEPWWNKAAEEQAINRLHRIGQKATVMSYSLYMKDTIEEKIRELQEQKSLLVDTVISTDSGSGKMLTEEDINFILAPRKK
ncbi:MAG: SNF2-related protein [Clostridium sp.]|nr:SNF2-related protein [Clostridium sp.]